MSTATLRPLLAALGLALWMAGAQADATIVIVRHGEKPPAGLGQLSCQGLNRALALPQVLVARYGQPVAIYAPNPSVPKEDKGVPYAYVRPLATVEPLAIQAGLPVNVQWDMTNTSALSQQLMAQAALNTGTQVVAWEHHWGEQLARTLIELAGGDARQVPHWDDADFDSIFVLRLHAGAPGQAQQLSFSHEHEGLDGRPATCPP